MRQLINVFVCSVFLVFTNACSNGKNEQIASNEKELQTSTHSYPTFNEQNAFSYIEAQLAFGHRIPGTESHKKTADYLIDFLKKNCDTVSVQRTTLTLGDKTTKVPCINIIGSFNPSAKRRILLLAHWDSRPWADMDFKDRDKPIMAADDGASGVGVLMEISNIISQNKLTNPDLGIDILFADVEDYAKSDWGNDAYALGTKYWAENPHIKGYTAEAGILLDMVGAMDARFAVEYNSQVFAKQVVNDVWEKAQELGYGKYFVYEQGGSIFDDHIPVNEIAKIPTIDIINQPANSSTGFVGHWHTHDDDISKIDKATLKAVGQTVIGYIYSR